MEVIQVLEQAAKTALPLAITVVTWLGTRAAQLVAGRVRTEAIRGVLLRLNDAVASVVRELAQTSVEPLKATSADGRLPQGAREAVKSAALASVRLHLGARGVAEIAGLLGLAPGDVDRVLASKIEATVHMLRAAGRARLLPRGEDVPVDDLSSV